MIEAYDKVLKKHVESFLKIGNRKITVIGLANDDDTDEETFSQAGANNDKIVFPIVAIFRQSPISLTDASATKRPSNYEGYFLQDLDDDTSDDIAVHLNSMRCDLKYCLDTYAENKKACEDLIIQIYFRLRNNPHLKVKILLPKKTEKGESIFAECIPDIVMDPDIQSLRSKKSSLSQLYKMRITFMLRNTLILDTTERQSINVEYTVIPNTPES